MFNFFKKDENPLETYFYNNTGREIHKCVHYFEIYHKYFEKFRNKKVKVVEFGVNHGGSIEMWKDYFGKKAKIIGVDINPQCKEVENLKKNIEIYIGNQEDRNFLKRLFDEIGEVDIVIEDGGHMPKQQINTFEESWPYIKEGGIYLVEDLVTSYWKRYDGGYKKEGTFIEYGKNLVDSINAWFSKEEDFKKDFYTETINGMHIYPSVIVFEKGTVKKSYTEKTGKIFLKQ